MHQMFSFKDLLFPIRVHPRWKVFVSNFFQKNTKFSPEKYSFIFFLNEYEYPQRYFYDFEPYQVAGFTPGDFLSKRLLVEATSCRPNAKREITVLALINQALDEYLAEQEGGQEVFKVSKNPDAVFAIVCHG